MIEPALRPPSEIRAEIERLEMLEASELVRAVADVHALITARKDGLLWALGLEPWDTLLPNEAGR